MRQARQQKTLALTGIGVLSCLVLGSCSGEADPQENPSNLGQWFGRTFEAPWSRQQSTEEPSAVLQALFQEAAVRDPALMAIAEQKRASLERSRARYVLAMDAIADLDGGKTIRLLDGLEDEYPLLAPYVHLKRARAYELTNQRDRSRGELEEIVEKFADSPVRADALVELDTFDAAFGDRAITEHPSHPRTHELVRQRLEENPNQPKYLLLLAEQTPDAPRMSDVRKRLVEKHSTQLSPESWQAIADGYWEQWEYGKAASAYRKAPPTATNLYRIGRGLDLKDNPDEAKRAYQKFLGAFPEAEEGGLALLHLARLTGGVDALPFFDRAIASFPDHAPTALWRKASLQSDLGRREAASETYQQLLKEYSTSDEAADYRWRQAKKYAKQGDALKAWQWAHPIATENTESSLVPKASYWVGKWATKLNRAEDAQAAYKYVLRNHPESYYAWRSASQLGLDVGSFTTVRQRSPQIQLPQQRPMPPAGSEQFRELYRLGQDEDAAMLWGFEQAGNAEPTVAETFTTALIQGTQGDYLESINSIWSLTQRKTPEEREAWQALRATPEYWHALFPFPYKDAIVNWSAERQLNPLLVVSLMRQESRFQPEIRSPAGALGLMQVMPATGEEVAQNIGVTDYSLINPEDNITLGTWYLDFTHGEFDGNSMLAIASYNAGPGNVSKWLRQFNLRDPDEFVEKIPFGETKGYVESVFGNYWNYLRLYSPEMQALIQSATK